MQLSAEHVFARLCIEGVGEEVKAFLTEEDPEDCIKEEEFEVPPETEPIGESEDAPDTQPICEFEDWQPIFERNVWHSATLRGLALPHAHIEITFEMWSQILTKDGKQERKIVGTKSRLFKVHVDNLRPIPKDPKNEPTKQPLHPTLRDGGEVMEPYDYELSELPFHQCIVEHALAMALASAQLSVERVSTVRLSAKGKSPAVLQCRAVEPFKKGQLLLVPAVGDILFQGRDNHMYVCKGDGFQPQVAPTKKKNAIHKSMLSQVTVHIRGAVKDKRKNRESEAQRTFEIRSPLLDTQGQRDGGLNPFWAVLRCVGPKSLHNMEFDREVIVVPQLHLKIPGIKRRDLEFCVEIPVLRNVAGIEANDILTMPWQHDEDEP